ncbi:hypothetical protein [Bradyrhizobium sp. 18]|uniref:hypothetical protein n=1 Tax=Bradyrhizobium sp. 18 TaxID=2782657 RepID=UPI001FFAF0BD|nr:hypothetical protein [Bradyrhizobium sp. 18]
MAAIASQPIDAGANKEVSANLLRQAIQFVDVAFAVADMNATLRLSEPFDRLPQIVELSNALLLLDGNAGRVDLLLDLGRALEFFRVQNFTAANPRGRPSMVTARLECISIPQTV